MAEADAALNDMIARHAVLEQIVLNMLAVMSRDFETPKHFREAILDDVRSRFAEAANGPAGDGKADFARLALERVSDIAERMDKWRDDEPLQ